jgi:hypothetical protein
VHAVQGTQNGATWGLDRIDQQNLPLNGIYNYAGKASDVTAYIIDTGVHLLEIIGHSNVCVCVRVRMRMTCAGVGLTVCSSGAQPAESSALLMCT